MKRSALKPLVVSSVVVLIISSCSTIPSDSVIQTAIAKTQIAQITNTQVYTAIPVSTSTLGPTDTSTPTATQEPEYFLGDAVYKNGYALTALSVQDPFIDPYSPQIDKNNKFIAVEVIISNISGGSLLVDYAQNLAKVVDKDGFSYPYSYMPSEDSIFTMWVEPGEKIKGNIVFETPASFVPSNIKMIIHFLNRENPEGPLLEEETSLSLQPAPEGHFAITEPKSDLSVKTLPSIGTPIIKDGYSLTVQELNNSATTPYHSGVQKAGYKYVGVKILLENIQATNPLDANPNSAYLIDDRGFIYPPWDAMAGEILTAQLAPGEKADGWVLYYIPKDTVLYSLKYIYDWGGNKEGFLQSGMSQ